MRVTSGVQVCVDILILYTVLLIDTGVDCSRPERDRVHRIKEWMGQARNKKLVKFDDLDKIVRRLLARYGEMFPDYTQTRSGSKTVHHFNIPELMPISLEREHGSREFLPPRYKTFALDGLDAVVVYIESNLPQTTDVDADDPVTDVDSGSEK